MNKSPAIRVLGILSVFSCCLLPEYAAQIVNHGSDLGYGGYGGVDTAGRAYGGAIGNGAYYGSGIDPNGRRYAYSGSNAGRYPGDPSYPGYYGDSAFSYNRPNGYYGRDRYYYGYYNAAVNTKSSFYYITILSAVALLFLKYSF